ncbi:MAG: hypothetical protein ONB25_06055 [candidate division KSB1 bacterium]|nr:hypothetical protein [candidate division KSB1 bacterium]
MRARNGLRFLLALLFVQVSLVLTLLGVHQALGVGGHAEAWCNADKCPGGCITWCDLTQYGCMTIGSCFCGCWCGSGPMWTFDCATQQ